MKVLIIDVKTGEVVLTVSLEEFEEFGLTVEGYRAEIVG